MLFRYLSANPMPRKILCRAKRQIFQSTQMIPQNKGFGLIEIMVGLAIGLISMLVILQVYGAFEDQKRTTTAGGDAQTNGALALYLMEREIRMAGNTLTEGEPEQYPPLAGCMTHIYDNDVNGYMVPAPNAGASTLALPGTVSAIRLAPAIINGGGGGKSDSVSIVYGTASVSAPIPLGADYTAGNMAIAVTSISDIRNGDMVALIQNASTTSFGNYITPRTCSLLQVSAAPTANSVPVATGRYNRSGGTGLPVFESAAARLHKLGQFNMVTYRIDATGGSGVSNLVADITKFGVIPDGTLTGTQIKNLKDFSPLASNIVNMKAQYGVDTGNSGTRLATCHVNRPETKLDITDSDGVVDAWVEPAGQWANDGAITPTLFDLRRIRAVRVGLVARDGQKEVPRPNDLVHYPDYPLCSTTRAAPVIKWDSGPSMTPDLTADPDWKCYRYKVFQTTIPIRNTIWSSTLNPVNAPSCES